jgi:hypothetical protein
MKEGRKEIPDYVGAWSSSNFHDIPQQLQREPGNPPKIERGPFFYMYLDQDSSWSQPENPNQRITGKIVDLYGNATFEGVILSDLIKFKKTYSPEAQENGAGNTYNYLGRRIWRETQFDDFPDEFFAGLINEMKNPPRTWCMRSYNAPDHKHDLEATHIEHTPTGIKVGSRYFEDPRDTEVLEQV